MCLASSYLNCWCCGVRVYTVPLPIHYLHCDWALDFSDFPLLNGSAGVRNCFFRFVDVTQICHFGYAVLNVFPATDRVESASSGLYAPASDSN